MKSIRIAIVEDSRPYLNLLSIFLDQIAEEHNFKIETILFDNPVDYKLNRERYDIVILDYVFRQYTYGSNGFYLARHTKDIDPKTKIVINSSYGKEEIGEMLEEFDQYVDAYSHKSTDMYEEEGGLLVIMAKIMLEKIKEKTSK